MNLQKTQFLKRWSLLLLIPLMVLAHNVTNAFAQSAETNKSLQQAKGPNGGKILSDGNVTLELAIFERGVPPEYRAWITQDGKPVKDAKLTVTLTRLGGQQDIFNFNQNNDYWLGDGVVTEPHSFDVSVDLRLDGSNYQWQWQSYEGRIQIKEDMAKKVGITTQPAGPASIERHLPVYGRLVTPPDQKAHIRARFPGVVTAVHVNIGDQVNKGDVLAIIESNESLQRYELRAPIAGIIQERSVNVGETVTNAPLLTLVSNKKLWAEFKIFPGQRSEVQAGQIVHIIHNNHTDESKLTHITTTSSGSPYVIARAVLNNEDGEMAPGDLVQGQIDVEKIEVPLAVDNRGLQSFRNWTVVFIKVGDTYEIRPLKLGLSDGRYTEILIGLNPGDNYVVENSYLIKADIEKSGASHDH
ncbi:efflux RND transporter periplasmic adaptor subunit [Kangiella aquimarina]|uniref:Efflux RND transporter periplasmic adaptor subunit n=1 Tax=Kangiella aquimarina TaxID=261965 RepID=A0ABZ0X1T8_9GAMM|nr:efflux RND transporter periplasmic adaptor subunit [Kangiella aquimarina]WQG84469.1 efflux RND transporter periplasmic adaptor subunit [Kangiella aquimarina]